MCVILLFSSTSVIPKVPSHTGCRDPSAVGWGGGGQGVRERRVAEPAAGRGGKGGHCRCDLGGKMETTRKKKTFGNHCSKSQCFLCSVLY